MPVDEPLSEVSDVSEPGDVELDSDVCEAEASDIELADTVPIVPRLVIVDDADAEESVPKEDAEDDELASVSVSSSSGPASEKQPQGIPVKNQTAIAAHPKFDLLHRIASHRTASLGPLETGTR